VSAALLALLAAVGTAQDTASAQAPAPTQDPVTPQASASADAEASKGASPRAVHTRLGAAQPRLGEPFDYEIEIRHPSAETYAPPSRVDLAPFDAEPLGCRRAGVPGGDGERLTTCAWRLRVFDLGAHDVPAITFEAATPGGGRTLAVPGPRVEAAGLLDPKAGADQLQLRPPAPPVPLVVRSWRLAWWAAGLLAAAVAAAFLWRWWRRRARAAAEPEPPLPPDERFARRLDALAAERLPEQGRSREFFFRLSEAVREYLGALTGVNALDLTTGELLDALAAAGDPRLDLARLRDFSEDADLVKFARFPAGGAECEAGMRYARELLERTRPVATATGTMTSSSTSSGGRP
jgi:hypothetical protein